MLTLVNALTPQKAYAHRVTLEELGRKPARACLTFGYMERLNVPRVLVLLPVAWRTDPIATSLLAGPADPSARGAAGDAAPAKVQVRGDVPLVRLRHPVSPAAAGAGGGAGHLG